MPKTIKDLPERSRPREKLREKGAASLTDEELVAAILGMGIAAILGFRVLDHVIVGRNDCFSFQEAGLIE